MTEKIATLKDAYKLLEQHGFYLARSKKHRVYKHPDGRTVILPVSGSDWRGLKNAARDLRNIGIDCRA